MVRLSLRGPLIGSDVSGLSTVIGSGNEVSTAGSPREIEAELLREPEDEGVSAARIRYLDTDVGLI